MNFPGKTSIKVNTQIQNILHFPKRGAITITTTKAVGIPMKKNFIRQIKAAMIIKTKNIRFVSIWTNFVICEPTGKYF